MQTPEIILSRIDRLHEGLSQAVNEPGGARFALMMSMIWDARVQAGQAQEEAAGEGKAEKALQRLDLYTPELVGRLNESFRSGNLGDVHLLLSWLETAPLIKRAAAPEPQNADFVPIAQAALMAKRYTALDEVHESQHRIAA